ncbi:glycoside hydrolase [Penicillium odoratum]|uniref:glycoside hydrolase n=1 Tax=Penicillium odoratum TaxID=1167516 RepID=UPI002549BBB4|nr:glycoside hydrolase [Penicillium odoratum]KAJ5745883.1 glycoside hydrolase [Penicillium odoratum]
MRAQVLAAMVASLLVTLSAARRNIIDNCPYTCTSNDTTSWISYHSADRLAVCNETMLLDFLLHNPLNDTQTQSTIYACTTPNSGASVSKRSTSNTNATDVSLELGTWGSSTSSAISELLSVIEDIEAYPTSFANDGKSSTIFGYNGDISVGIISGEGAFDQMAIQYCGTTSNYIVGLAVSTDDDLPAVQHLVKTWSLSECVTGFEVSENISSSLEFKTGVQSTTSLSRRSLHTHYMHGRPIHGGLLQRRGDCTTVQVVWGYLHHTRSRGWLGCDDLQAGENICLSEGEPPFPSAVESAVCGPQVPDTTANGTDSSEWADLNPCPLNACCDVWGECGITPEFCTATDSTTGNPGTAASGTNGCISNCGINITNNDDAPDEFYAIGYFEAFNIDRACLTMEVYSIDTSAYTHIIYAFGLIDSDYSISINVSQSDVFEQFLALEDVKRIVSFGGWDFSTDVDTYMIFREGVTSDNRETFAQNVADFISTNDIDGVDFDWEYPGQPDIEGIPAGSDDDGTNYLAFLKELRSLVGDNITISIAIPASFWYLQGFPVSDLNDVVDFFIYMTYDLHGQWGYGNDSSDDGCTDGNCLRSHVNLTETGYALAMATKGGAQSLKLMVGVSSYGRSFEMSTAGCTGPDCTYTGPDSGATPGRCTQTAGYISNAEIDEIISTNPSVEILFDDDSDSDIIVYNDTQWVGYMTTTTKSTRTTYYQGLNMGGTTEWAIDLEEFIEDPDDISIVNLSTDLSDEEQCETPDSSTVTSAEASSDRNVAGYIDSLITNTLKNKTAKWDKTLFGNDNVDCSSFPTNEDCNFPNSSTCTSYAEPARYWAQFVAAIIWFYMDEYYELFDVAKTNVTDRVQQLVTDFPVQSPDTIPDLASLFTNFGGALGIVSSFTGDGLATTLTAAAGGLFSEAGSKVSSDDDDHE